MRRVLTLAITALLVTAMFAPVATASVNPAGEEPLSSFGSEPNIDATSIHQTPGTTSDRAYAGRVSSDGESFSAGAMQTSDSASANTDTPIANTDGNETDDNETEGEFADEPIGKINGYWHNDSINIDQSDGLSDDELDAFVHRKMARVEFIRERKFRSDVPVEVISREEFRKMQEENETDETFNRWNNQIWKGLFIVGEDESAQEEIQNVFSGAVAGFYSPAEDQVVIVTEDGDNPVIDGSTLLHELDHAMQDQYHNLSKAKYRGTTQDQDLAIDGIVEGEAVYVERRYEERCESGEWDCVETPDTGSSSDGPDPNLGIFVTIFHPYSDGPGYAADIVESDGWLGLTERMEAPPNSTAQVIHRTDREPVKIEYEHTAQNGWEPYPNQGDNGADTVGEASIFAMFWYQEVFDRSTLTSNVEHEYERYNYVSDPSAGWANDKLFPYRRGEDQDGYVWVTEWTTERDAEQFYQGYLQMLDGQDVEQRNQYHVIDDGPFRGTYLLTANDTRVTIVHGPSADAVDDIRPNLDVSENGVDDDPDDPTDPYATDQSTDSADLDSNVESPGPTQTDTPGFGIVLAIAGLLAGAALLGRHRERKR